MAEVLMEFPQLTMSMPDGREESIMKRTCLVRVWGGNVSVCVFVSTLVACGAQPAAQDTN